MRRDWKPWGKAEPPPIELAGELERVPRASGTATAMLQVNLRVILESKAARSLRGALERDGKRIAGETHGGEVLTAFCVDVAELDLQKYTGTVRACSCDLFDRAA